MSGKTEWLDPILEAWAPPPLLGGWEWADEFRVLGEGESGTPGPWRTFPWQKSILDAFADASIDWVVILKAAQMGVSELVRCAIGRWAMLDPGDVLWVMADQKSATKAMNKLRLMFANTPALQHLAPSSEVKPTRGKRKTKDTLLEMVLTNGMRIVIGWASSPASLASDYFPRVVLDETGLYKGKIGKEGSPIGLAEERTKTAGRRRKIILLSKPAHADDLICTSHDECLDQRERQVPCPDCGEVQSLHWEAVRWRGPEGQEWSARTAPSDPIERIQMAGYVEANRDAAWIECSACEGRIGNVAKADRAEASTWTNVNIDSPTRRRAFHVSEIFHWVKGLHDLVARYLRAVKASDVQNFYTGSLGRPYEHERSAIRKELFEGKAIHTPGEVPPWATLLLATADTQKDHFWLRIHAWGEGSRTRTLDWCRVETFEDLTKAWSRHFTIAGTGIRVRAARLLIDAGGGTAGGALDGSRSLEVYRYAARTPGVVAVKGSGEKRGATQGMPVTWIKVTYGSEKAKLKVCSPHANYWKDETATLVRSERWEEPTTAADAVYTSHMTGQRQVYEELTPGNGRWVWKKKKGRPDHLWDAAYLQVVGAEVLRADLHELLIKQISHARDNDYEEHDGDDSWQVGRR